MCLLRVLPAGEGLFASLLRSFPLADLCCRIEYLTTISSFAIAAVTFPVMCETYPPLLLARRARRLRVMTQNWALRAKSEESQSDINDFAERYLLRPARMLVLEPILLLFSLYISVSFGTIRSSKYDRSVC
jgi:MFS transporter, DHA1 family, multidrug resistance protein